MSDEEFEDSHDFSDGASFSEWSQNAETLLAVKQEFSRVEKALAKLPERQRTALLLKSQEEMSYEDIGEVMNCSASSVESLIFRARKKLLDLTNT